MHKQWNVKKHLCREKGDLRKAVLLLARILRREAFENARDPSLLAAV